MSVSETINLPAQPSSGVTVSQPMGGNGYHAPVSQTYVEAAQTGDGTGGTNTITVRFDPDHMQMLNWLQIQLDNQTGDVVVHANLVFGPGGDGMNLPFVVSCVHDPRSNNAFGFWRPVPVVAAPRPPSQSSFPLLQVTDENTNGTKLTVRAMLYDFNPTAAQVTPFGWIAENFQT